MRYILSVCLLYCCRVIFHSWAVSNFVDEIDLSFSCRHIFISIFNMVPINQFMKIPWLRKYFSVMKVRASYIFSHADKLILISQYSAAYKNDTKNLPKSFSRWLRDKNQRTWLSIFSLDGHDYKCVFYWSFSFISLYWRPPQKVYLWVVVFSFNVKNKCHNQSIDKNIQN